MLNLLLGFGQRIGYKVTNRNELQVINGVRQFVERKDNVEIPLECCIAVFHGDPNPGIVQDKFVVENWV